MYLDQTGHSWALPLIRTRTAHSVGLQGFYEYQLETDVQLDETTVKAGQAASSRSRTCARSAVLHGTCRTIPYCSRLEDHRELGPRPGGWRQFLYESAYGIDNAYNGLLVKIGLEPENLGGEPIAYSLIANTYAEDEGIIETIDGTEEALQLLSVRGLETHYGPGDLALPSGKGGKILADAKCHTQIRDQLFARRRQAP